MEETQRNKKKLDAANKKIRILEDMIEDRTRSLYTANEVLRKQKEELENYARLVSHDLREPVLTIQGFSKLLAKSLNMDKTEAQYFKLMHESSKRLLTIIDSILGYTQINSDASMESVATSELLQHITSDISQLIKNSNANLIINDLPTVTGVKPLLYSLFQNLITNAIKFVPQDKQPIVEISGKDEKTNYSFTIKDNGIGISEDNANKIFIMSERLNDNYKGSGVGLAHCKKIIELHKGNIWVESTLGFGSTFHFTIPQNLSA